MAISNSLQSNCSVGEKSLIYICRLMESAKNDDLFMWNRSTEMNQQAKLKTARNDDDDGDENENCVK